MLVTESFVSVYLLHILLEHTQLQPLVKSDLSMLPNVLQTPLMVKNLVHHVQDAVNLSSYTNWFRLYVNMLKGYLLLIH